MLRNAVEYPAAPVKRQSKGHDYAACDQAKRGRRVNSMLRFTGFVGPVDPSQSPGGSELLQHVLFCPRPDADPSSRTGRPGL